MKDISANYLLECSNFEKLLQRRDDFIDYVDDNQGISIKDVRISSIIKVTGEIYIPEQFDMVHLIDQYKDMIVSQVDYEDNNQRELILLEGSSNLPETVSTQVDGTYHIRNFTIVKL